MDVLKLAEDVDAGTYPAIDALRQLYELKKKVELAYKAVQEKVIEELDSYPGRSRDLGDITVKVTNGRRTYSFEHDAEWVRLNTITKSREELMKAAAEHANRFLGQPYHVDGEVIPAAVVKYGADYITITNNK